MHVRWTKIFTLTAGSALIAALSLTGINCAATAPPPPEKVVVVPARPYPNAVWVPGHWVWRRWGRHWEWVPGHWKFRRGGRWVYVY